MKSEDQSKPAPGPKRKYLRFRNRPLHNIKLQVKENSPGLRLSNISMGGVGILAEPKDDYKDEFSAILTIGNKRFDVHLIKVFRDSEIMGCRFEEINEDLGRCIDKYFQAELMALNLNRVETPSNRQEKTIFFHSQNNCELLINERNGQINYFSIIVLGNCLEIDAKGKLAIGQLIVDDKVPRRNGLLLFKSVETPETYIFEIAKRFVEAVKDLSPEYRKNLTAMMDNSMSKENIK